MSQTPHPHDPYGTEPGTPASEPFAEDPQPEVPAHEGTAPQADDQGAPTSDPALHPHDPYAYDADAAPAEADSAQDPAAAPDPYGAPAPAPQAVPAAAMAPPSGYGSQQQGGQAPYGSGAPSGEAPDQPQPGTRGVFEGPLTGEPISRSDSRLWATISQAAVALGHVVSWGFLGWVGPLIIFLMYKDRDRFVRFHATEALNGAIAVFIAQVVLSIAIAIFGVFTFTIGWALFPLAGLPALLQLVFSIIGAVKANRGEYWNYPVNIRLVK